MYTIVCIYEDLPCRELLAEYLASLDIPAASQPHEGEIVFNNITVIVMPTPLPLLLLVMYQRNYVHHVNPLHNH